MLLAPNFFVDAVAANNKAKPGFSQLRPGELT